MRGWPSRRRVGTFLPDRSANLATMTALMAPVGLIMAAIAVDTGSLFTQRRELQSFADVAAITASANLANAETAVVMTLTKNGMQTVRIERDGQTLMPAEGEVIAHVIRGGYTGTIETAVGSRFVAGKVPNNAVRVTLKSLGQRYFGTTLIAAPLITTRGTARITATAAFTIGSRLASLQGGLANTLLSGLLGGNVSLSVMDYSALMQADISLFDFMDSLATEAHITAGSYSDVLATDVSVKQAVTAMSKVTGLDPRAKIALQGLATAIDKNLKLQMDAVVNLGENGYLSLGRRPAGLTATANVLEMLTASGGIANGDSQVSLNLAGSIAGLLSATLDLAVGEPPQSAGVYTIGEIGQIVRTAQTRLLLTVELLGPGGILGTSIKVPIYIELASGEASIAAISCNNRNPATGKVTIAAKPGVAKLQIANIDAPNLKRFDRSPVLGAANLITLPLVTVTGQAQVDITNQNPTYVDFSRGEIDQGVTKTVATRDAAKTLTDSLLQNLTLNVKLAGIDLGLSGVLKATLSGTLTAAAPAIDQLLMSVLDTLGISVGEMDIKTTGATCPRPALVQ